MKKLTVKVIACGLAGVMGVMAPMTALAANPDFSRSAVEWARLEDNYLEYKEIPDLIHEYNATVQSNQHDLNIFISDYGRYKDDISNSYRKLAADLEGAMSGADGMGMVSDLQLKLQADQMLEQADDNLEDAEILKWNYSQAEDNLVMSAQSRFISYYKYQLELESARENLTILKNSLSQTELRRDHGAATEMQVLDAKEEVISQEKTIKELEAQIESARKKLIVMCGWQESDMPEIGSLPKLNVERLDEIDPEADKQKALDNNYTLKINKRKLENALEASTKDKYISKIKGNERQISLSVTSAWQSLKTALRDYEKAQSDAAYEEQNMELTKQKWNAGMIVQKDYENAEATLNMKKLSVEIKYLELIESYEIYRWNVKGLAAAE